ncbi:MAG: DNA repair protein RecN [Burkholderiaceae bacterium]|nr:MAG: DNA repair protein RecN [Burkholderiaceae bacterium]
MALRHLSLRDFVIVSSLDLELDDGFSALTGETGAGKSILVDALQLVLGARGDALWVREGAARCELAAEFDCPESTEPWLEANGFDRSDTLLMRRTIDASAKSRAWINGSPATVGQLRELGDLLVDIHGQHAWQSLTRADSVRRLVDDYAGVDSSTLQNAWQAWKKAEAALAQAQATQQHLATERERLTRQIREIEQLAPQENEWDELDQRHTRLSHAQALIEAARDAGAALESEDGGADALTALSRARETLESQRAIEPNFQALLDVLQSCEAQLRDVAHGLNAYLRQIDLDPEQLAEVDQRVGGWISLARRYRREPRDLPALLAGWHAELVQLEAAANLEQLQATVQVAQRAWQAAAKNASGLRAKAAPRLAGSVTDALQGLGMAGAIFSLELTPLKEPASFGLEDPRFLIAAHDKTTPHPIERVASGGELSRIALALAVTTSAAGSAGTLVFDEIDAGIGGSVASTVGHLLRQLGENRQVLCVTHLAQVAAHANHHWSVHKSGPGNGAIQSTVEAVTGSARVEEIGRMLGGEAITEVALQHAREMLDEAASERPPAARRKKA